MHSVATTPPHSCTQGASSMRRSASASSMAALAAAQQQQTVKQHPGVSRLRSHIPRAFSHTNLAGCGVEGPQTSSMNGASRQAPALQNQKEAQNSSAAASVATKPMQPQTSAPMASLTRVFLIGQPSNFVRNLAGRKMRGAGPVSLLLFLAGLVLAILTAVRGVLVRRVKSCTCCKGFGITRCRLCNGEGAVEWAGKSNHQEMCPLCMTKRFVTCTDCGGFYHRPLFSHVQPTGRGPVPEFLGAS